MVSLTTALPTEVEIEKLVYGGDGLARVEGQVVLTPYVLPGERVSVLAQRAKGGVQRGTPAKILQASPERIEAKCRYFSKCGGCHWQHAVYAFQLSQKKEILRETLRRIGGIDYSGEIQTISAEPWEYRNRVQLHFNGGQCGFHRAGSHVIEPVTECPIAAPLLSEAIRVLSEAARKPAWPEFLRSLELFTNGVQLQVNVVETNRPVAARFFTWLKELLPLMLDGALDYPAAGHTFRISGGSFFQTNRFLLDALVDEVIHDASGESAVDLYSGVGLFTLPLAKRFARVEAVERGGSAFRDLQANLSKAGSVNIMAQHVPAEEFMRDLQSAPDFLVADPPRAGLGPDATAELLRLRPRILTVVSCDPATFARDLKKLLAGGYRVGRMALVDLFPQTYHFETVTRLEL